MKNHTNTLKIIINDMFFIYNMKPKKISTELDICISTVYKYIREIKKDKNKNYILLKNDIQLIWSNDEKLLSASSQNIGGYSNSYKNYTYRIIKLCQ